MAKDCWICQQKDEWRNEKLNKVRNEAKQYAIEHGKTVAIWKEGTNYKYGIYTGQANCELVSFNT